MIGECYSSTAKLVRWGRCTNIFCASAYIDLKSFEEKIEVKLDPEFSEAFIDSYLMMSFCIAQINLRSSSCHTICNDYRIFMLKLRIRL